MKKILTLILVSALGGVFTLGAYKLFIEDDNKLAIEESKEDTLAIPVNSTNFSKYAVAETVDFKSAAEKTIHTVVHVKNTTVGNGRTTFEDLFLGRNTQRAQIGTGSGVIISQMAIL